MNVIYGAWRTSPGILLQMHDNLLTLRSHQHFLSLIRSFFIVSIFISYLFSISLSLCSVLFVCHALFKHVPFIIVFYGFHFITNLYC